MKFLIDMNLTPHWVGFFVDQGFEAVHWSDVGPGDASDGMLMEWAAGHGFVVVTSDLDFGAILAASRQRYPSVVQIRSDLLTPEAIGASVLAGDPAVRIGFGGWSAVVGRPFARATAYPADFGITALSPGNVPRNPGEWALVRPRLDADQLIGLDRLPPWL